MKQQTWGRLGLGVLALALVSALAYGFWRASRPAPDFFQGQMEALETDVARFHADAEAVYSYEGTHEINALVVGRSLTGKSAFA